MLAGLSSRGLSEWMAFYKILEAEHQEREMEAKAAAAVERP